MIFKCLEDAEGGAMIKREWIKTWPKQIYLQNGASEEGEEPVYPTPPFNEDTVTWCVDQIYDADVVYIREDVVKQMVCNAKRKR